MRPLLWGVSILGLGSAAFAIWASVKVTLWLLNAPTLQIQ
jgi:hypothetical protein